MCLQEYLTIGHVADQTEFNIELEEQGLYINVDTLIFHIELEEQGLYINVDTLIFHIELEEQGLYRSFVTYKTRFSQVLSYIIQLRQKDTRQSCITL